MRRRWEEHIVKQSAVRERPVATRPAADAVIPEHILAALPVQLRAHSAWEHRTRPGALARVWRSVEGPEAWLKLQPSPRKFAQERLAYEYWAPFLEDTVPTLMAIVGREEGFLLTELPGVRPRFSNVDRTRWPQLVQAAGAWLRRLHEVPALLRDDTPLRQAMRQRAAAWRVRAAEVLDPELAAAVDRVLADDAVFEGCERVCCHRDFQPRNWLVCWEDSEPMLGVVDFEHSRLDCRFTDLCRIWYAEWMDDALRTAFLDGYAFRADERAKGQLDFCCALHGIGTVSWGVSHGDVGFREAGRRYLERLIADA